MKIQYKHQLTEAEALKRLKKFAQEAKVKYKEKIQEVSEEWDGNKGKFMLKAMGSKAKGTLEVSGNNVFAEVSLPLIAKPFEKQIKNMIIDIFKELLDE